MATDGPEVLVAEADPKKGESKPTEEAAEELFNLGMASFRAKDWGAAADTLAAAAEKRCAVLPTFKVDFFLGTVLKFLES